MIVNQKPYPISFEMKMAQALNCRFSEIGRQYQFYPDVDISDYTVVLQTVKPDGTFTISECEIVTNEDPDAEYPYLLIVEIPQQATAVKGVGKYDIYVYDDDTVIFSAEGPLWVDDCLITEDMIESAADVFGLRFPQDFLTVNNLVDIVNYVAAELIKDDQTTESTTWSSQKISDELANVEVDDMTGATAGTAGIHGLVPAPAAGDEGKFLSGAGTWEDAGGLHVFSTDEQIIGTWIDGRPVYEKTFNVGTLSSNNTNVNHNITDFERILSVTGSGCMYNFADTIPLFMYMSSSMFSSINGADSTRFILYVSNDILTYYKYDVTMTVRYLKTA